MRSLLRALAAAFGALPLPVRVLALLAAVVGAGAAVLSWDAGRWAAGEIGIDPNLTWLWPVVVDGMIGAGTVGSWVVREPFRTRAYVWVLLLSGLAVSTFANAAHAPEGGPIIYGTLTLHRAGSAVASLALAATLHLLVITARPARPAGAARAATEETKRGTQKARPRRTAGARLEALLGRADAPVGTKELAGKLGVSPGHVRKLRARLSAEESAA